MSTKKVFFVVAALIVAAFALSSCQGAAGPEGPAGPAGPQGPAGPAGEVASAADLSCTQCHNDQPVLAGKQYAWALSKHGTESELWLEEGTRLSCSGCHSGSAFMARVAAGLNFMDWGTSDSTNPDPTPQTCRTCHTIHTTYTQDDLALRTVAAVPLVKGGVTFDKGMGNLCADCHQARRYMPDFPFKDEAGNAVAGQYAVTVRFNPHLSNQADVVMGVGGGGTVQGAPGAHYSMTSDACVTCHLGEGANHTFQAEVSACVTCHADAEDTDINGKVTEMQGKFDTLKAGLTAIGLLDEEGSPVPPAKGQSYDEAHAWPLWVYGYVMEDGSMGVHNPTYISALLDAAIAAIPAK